MALTATQLLNMSQAELDRLFEDSPAGDIPSGEAEGTAIVGPGTELSPIAARFIHIFAWKGKVFDPERGILHNRILPFGEQAVIAQVYRAPSWLDGKECIVLDYSKTSLIAHWIRDEIRLIAPALYLGIVYWDRHKLINFSLDFSRNTPPAS
jgi:hypothetical protein